MPGPAQLGLVDLIVALVVIAAVVGALRRGSGALSAAASGFLAALVCWLIAGALIAWGPGSMSAATARSALVHTVPPPVSALSEAGNLLDRSGPDSGPAPAPAR